MANQVCSLFLTLILATFVNVCYGIQCESKLAYDSVYRGH